MNYKCITYILGWILKVEGVFLALPLAVSLLYREGTWPVFLACALLSLVLGTALSFKRPENFQFYAREGYVGVALGWIVMSLVGALPFYFTGEIPSFTDSLFEIISGFTTTGASILPRVEELSNGILIWRSFSHWIGGMGVLVFVLQIMPMTSGQTMHLMRAESPGAFCEQAGTQDKNHCIFPVWDLCNAYGAGDHTASAGQAAHVRCGMYGIWYGRYRRFRHPFGQHSGLQSLCAGGGYHFHDAVRHELCFLLSDYSKKAEGCLLHGRSEALLWNFCGRHSFDYH